MPTPSAPIGWRFLHARWHWFAAAGSASGCGRFTLNIVGGGQPSRPPKPSLTKADRQFPVCQACEKAAAVPSTGRTTKKPLPPDAPPTTGDRATPDRQGITGRRSTAGPSASPAGAGGSGRRQQTRSKIREAKFVKELLKTGNATEAYQRARGGKGSRTGARTEAAKRLAKPRVQRAIAFQLLKVQTSPERVLNELAALAHVNHQDFVDVNGDLIPMHKLPREVAAAILSSEYVIKNVDAGDGHVDRVYKLKIHNKRESLELLAKHFGMLTEKVQFGADEKLLELLDAGRLRNAAAKEARPHA